jgi:hypothetical protein
LACRFTDVVVRTRDQIRFEGSYTPREGEALRSLQPKSSLAAYFDVPLGVELTYRVSGKLERLRSEIDDWGRSVLRSLDHRAELVFLRTETCFVCTEFRGSHRSVLHLLRLALSRVPFEADRGLTFRDVLPQRWLGGWLGGLRWDLTAPFVHNAGTERWSHLEFDGDCLAVVGASRKRGTSAAPRLETRAVLRRGVGPTLLELNIDGRTERAELMARPVPHALTQKRVTGPTSELSLRMGDYS